MLRGLQQRKQNTWLHHPSGHPGRPPFARPGDPSPGSASSSSGCSRINAAGVIWGGGSWTPKLALDLEGGTQIILEPKVETGQTVSQEQLDQAVSIIRQRVDASGVAEAEINTEGNNVVVRIPGELDDQTRDRIESSAKLELRAVLLAGCRDQPGDRLDRDPGAHRRRPRSSSPRRPRSRPTAATRRGSPRRSRTSSTTSTARPSTTPRRTSPRPTSRSSPATSAGTAKYLLGPVEASGENIVDATNGMVTTQTGASTGQWAVNIEFDEQGTEDFGAVSTRLYGLNGQTPRDQFAFVLDGAVITAPADERRDHRRHARRSPATSRRSRRSRSPTS